MAGTRNELKIRGVKNELEKYGLVFIVDYQTRKIILIIWGADKRIK